MAEHTSPDSAAVALANLGKLLPDLKALYIDIHAHPELSMQEARTAGLAAEGLETAGYEVTTGEGETGDVGLLVNGGGPQVVLSAAMAAVQIAAATGLPIANQVPAPAADGT